MATTANAFAEPPLRSAREHFDEGYAAIRRGDIDAAIVEFERAYQKVPNFSVLYNLGQAYASAGRSVEAVDTLNRYLELGGTAVQPERRSQVQVLIAYHSRRVSELELDAPAGTELSLDGKSLGTAPLAAPVRVVAGVHGLSASRPGFLPVTLSVTLEGRERRQLRIALSPLHSRAKLAVSCAIPDVAIEIDEREAATTPLRAALELEPGEYRLSFRRAGYVTSSRRVVLPAHTTTRIDCALSTDPRGERFTRLSVMHPVGTSVFIDGARFAGGPLPHGRHVVSVSGRGYDTVERTIVLAPNASQSVTLAPRRSSERLERERDERATNQRALSYILGGVGAAAATSSGVLYLATTRRYSDWQAESRRFIADYARDPASAPPRRLDALLDDERKLRNRDAIALGLGISACALWIASAVLYFTAERARPSLTLTARSLEQLELGTSW